jgi:hypothetical protein
MRNFEPEINICVVMDFEKDTGVKIFENPSEPIRSLTNIVTLLYYSVRKQYPRLSKETFIENLTPEEVSAATEKLIKEFKDFFMKVKVQEPEEPQEKSQEENQ